MNKTQVQEEGGGGGGVHSLDDDDDYELADQFCNIERLSRDELLEKLNSIHNEAKLQQERIWRARRYTQIFDFIQYRSLYLKSSQSSLQTCIQTNGQNLMGLIEYYIRLVSDNLDVGDVEDATENPQIIAAHVKKLLELLRDFLSNVLEIWEYLLTKIHSFVYGITLFLFLAFGNSEERTLSLLPLVYLVYEGELLEQEINEAYCGKVLKLEGLTDSTEQDKFEDFLVLALVLRHNATELLESMSSLVHHPQILNIHGELEHIKCFLEDLPKWNTSIQILKHLLAHIGIFNVKTGLVIHKLNVNGTAEGMTVIMENTFPSLTERAKLIKTMIYNSSYQLPMPSHFPLTNGLGFIDSLLKVLSNLLSSKNDWVSTIKENIELIYEELEKLSLFLKKTSNQHSWHGLIDDLQKEIIQFAYKTECVIDFILINHGSIDEFCRVKEEAKLINVKIAKLHDEKMVGPNEKIAKFLDVKKVGHNVSTTSQANLVTIEEVVGFEEETKTIMGQLIKGPDKLDVISIVGMPGLGKTTLAHKVYSQEGIINHFHNRAWCTISQNYDREELLVGAYRQVTGLREDKDWKADEVADYLRKSLIGKRYLIVLDDMWDAKVWDDFCRLLSPSEKCRSRIIITTRLHGVASYAKLQSNPLHLRSLNDQESWDLLVRKTFLNEDFPQELLGFGKIILGICQGLPLMIVLVAGILSSIEPVAHQWGEVAKKLSSHIATNEVSMKVIELSYKHLPDYLKPCFLYFGAFKEDEEVSVSMLIRLWIAEGFVQNNEQMVLEDVAREHLNALISCSLVMVTSLKRCSREAQGCRVHDLVHEFCLRKTREENFLHLIREGDALDSIFDDYRLSICFEYADSIQLFVPKLRGSCVRSFICSSSHTEMVIESIWIIQKFKLLRILDLSTILVPFRVFSSGLDSLIHLRYLALKCPEIHKFPCNLLNLETLWMEEDEHNSNSITLLQTIWHMVHLRHVKVPRLDLHNYGLEFFEGSSNLENLQSIGTVFELEYCEDEKIILRRFLNLRELKCKVEGLWDDVEECYKFPKLNFLHKLECLVMTGYARNMSPCKFYLPPNLKRLELGGFKLPWSEISIISTLSNLEELILDGGLKSEEWNVEEYVFPNIKFLEISESNIEKWVVSADSFPLLEELVLRRCWYLEEVPSCLGDIHTLKKIEMYYCKKSLAESAMKIKEEIQEIGGELNVLDNQAFWSSEDEDSEDGDEYESGEEEEHDEDGEDGDEYESGEEEEYDEDDA